MKPGRRTFIKHAAVGAAGGVLASSVGRAQSAASQDRTAGANSRLRVALIGCGGQGTGDLRNALRLGAECVALCDVDDGQVAKAAESIDRNFSQHIWDFREEIEYGLTDRLSVAGYLNLRSDQLVARNDTV